MQFPTDRPDACLVVEGGLEASGESGTPIRWVLTGKGARPKILIQFRPSGLPASLRHCRFENAQEAIQATRSVDIAHSVFRNCETAIALLDSPQESRIQENRFDRNDLAIRAHTSEVLIERNVFTGNHRAIVFAAGRSKPVIIRLNHVERCPQAAISGDLRPDSPREFVVIAQNNFIYCLRPLDFGDLQKFSYLPLDLSRNYWADRECFSDQAEMPSLLALLQAGALSKPIPVQDIAPEIHEEVLRQLQILRNGPGEDPYQAVWELALIGYGANAAVPDLLAAWRSGDERLSYLALQALGHVGHLDSRVMDAMTAALQSKKHQTFAFQWLGSVGPKARLAVPLLKKMLEEEKDYTRIYAAQALWKIGEKEAALPVLVAELKNKNQHVRSSVLGIFREIFPKPAKILPALTEALSNDEFDMVQEAAARLLGRYGPEAKEAVPALIRLAREGTPQGRYAAITALGQIGPDSEETVAALKTLAEDEEDGIRNAAATALKAIDESK